MRLQIEFHERLTHAADAKDIAGSRLRTFCIRSSPRSSIVAIIVRHLVRVCSSAFAIFLSDWCWSMVASDCFFGAISYTPPSFFFLRTISILISIKSLLSFHFTKIFLYSFISYITNLYWYIICLAHFLIFFIFL